MNLDAAYPTDEPADDDRARPAFITEGSKRVRDESMRINAEFAEIEQDPDA